MPIFRGNFTGTRIAPESGMLTNPAGMPAAGPDGADLV
jgi:hypothetical protein